MPKTPRVREVASYAGVTVRAVRHYHAIGLLPEPERDHSGYRRYDAAAVIELIRIRTLAEAGVPLARVRELLQVGAEEFAVAVADIDKQLLEVVWQRQRLRKRIARLAAGDNLALPRGGGGLLGSTKGARGGARRWGRGRPRGPGQLPHRDRVADEEQSHVTREAAPARAEAQFRRHDQQ
ncbi:MerR family transcriptional regulator, partial [Nocardia abscessus]|uniref:MerR family transcriptional regulator n=1 Tax=Nocardia abscessus TaxID=120957 RepID=UPI002458A4CC